MKKNIIISIGLVFITLMTALAQPPHAAQKKEQIKALKVAFITKELNLTTKEAQTFWPVFNEYDEKREALRKEERLISRKINNNAASLNEKELGILLEKLIKTREASVALLRTYKDKFLYILPTRKVAKLYVAERKFHKQLLQGIKKHRAQNRQQGQRY